MDSSKQEPFVRPCNPAIDEAAIFHICHQTVAPDLRHEPAASISPYIWAIPYIRLDPGFCFVLDSGSGTAVGYIVGTSRTEEFVTRYRSDYLPVLQSYGFTEPDMSIPAMWDQDLPGALRHILYSPEGMLHREFPELLRIYPGHLHIDLLPAYQRKGYGRKLMQRFCGKVREAGGSGVHLIMAGDNVGAEKFYGRVGFGRFSEILDGGLSGEEGRDVDRSMWLVRALH
ncbi:hypothetical protein MMC11_002234 [Xylographa trunciseda]|nr:hypothetical protein [Xylographa trunciseda]